MPGVIRLSKIELRLVQAQVFFRHGARTPLHYVKSPLADNPWTPETTKDYPKSVIPIEHVDIFNGSVVDEESFDLTYRPFKLPGGESIGMLTTKGQEDLYRLGIRIRQEYAGDGGILSDPPKLSEIEPRSTRVGRNIKSMRSLVAGLTGGEVEGELVIPSMDFDIEVLFPNPKTCTTTAFEEGTEELENDPEILELKEKIKKALQVDQLIDEFDNDPDKMSRDCQVYYVRDDYAARKHNGFPIPPELDALEPEIDHYSAVELTNELLGKRENWVSSLDVNIGPVLHIVLSKMQQYKNSLPLHLVAVHDSTILPILVLLDLPEELVWPPFGADIVFELFLQTMGPTQRASPAVEDLPDVPCPLDWSAIRSNQMWVRVRYLGRALPLARQWCSSGDDGVRSLTGSDDFVPLLEFVRRLSPFALSLEAYRARCEEFKSQMAAAAVTGGFERAPEEGEVVGRVPVAVVGEKPRGPKNI